jgi:hypothetical protein
MVKSGMMKRRMVKRKKKMTSDMMGLTLDQQETGVNNQKENDILNENDS